MNWKEYTISLRALTNIKLYALFCFILLLQSVNAQGIGNTKETLADTVASPADTVSFVMTKSPMGALGRSALIPGWGQIYNESYWKAPIVWGFLGYFVYGYLHYDNKFEEYKKLYISQNSNFSPQTVLRYREFYREQRDLFAVYIGLTYLLNLVDAYVDAHLFDFTVEENQFKGYNLKIQYKF